MIPIARAIQQRATIQARDILNELKCEQVITVSHERELEGFVDRIYRIRKEAGESRIEPIA